MLKYLCLCLAFTIACSQYEITECPDACSCDYRRIGCRRRSKNCLVLVTDCHNRTLTSVPNGIPSNSKAVLLNSNKIVNINLDGFQNFSELTVLTFGNNNALRFTLTQKLTKLNRLSLANNYISLLPLKELSKFLKRLTHLNLESNRIADIKNVRFPQKLEILNLNNNRIQSLSWKSFRKLKRLRVLKLNGNQIDSIYSSAFKDLNSLESLEMEDNRINKLVKNVFSPLTSGWYINLKNNSINEMHQMSFRLFGTKNENHCEIHLENNRLSFVERATIGEQLLHPQHYTIYIAGNPIFCDCNLIELRNETGSLLGDMNRAFCNSPRAYAGVSIKTLHIEECCYGAMSG